MRLTLRTLLSYLDDTLEPAQAKIIGAKVAESDQARELMERIKQVTRRRRLTTPPTSGPGGMDANTISEYLDSDVTPEQSTEVEQICLASDVHLAEVAACHQILTLVLGEPALVPPTAKQRMYTLVKGPESIPFRKPPKPGSKDDQDLSSELEPDQDDSLRLGVPSVTKGGLDQRNLYLIIGGGVLAALLLAVAVWQFVKPPPTIVGPGDKTEQLTQAEKDKLKKDADDKAAQAEKDKAAEDAKKKAIQDALDKAALDAKNKEANPGENPLKIIKIPVQPNKAPAEVPYAPANMQEKPIGKYLMPPARKPKDSIVDLADTAAVLLQKNDKDGWTRIAGKDAPVTSARTLVSLPGSKSAIALNGGVEATLWGNLPELTMDGSVLESRAILHVPAGAFDADLTLERGRIVLRNKKSGGNDAQIRVRFVDSVQPNEKDRDPDKEKSKETDKARQTYFDITLQGADATVVLDRAAAIEPGEPFFENRKDPRRIGPVTILRVYAKEGSASISYAQVFYAISSAQKSMLEWDSARAQLAPLKDPRDPMKDAPQPAWLTGVPDLKGQAALNREKQVNAHLNLAKDMDARDGKERLIDVVLVELKDFAAKKAQGEMIGGKFASYETFAHWQHAVRCSASVDLIGALYRDFADKQTPFFIRFVYLDTIEQWLNWSRDHDYELLDVVQKHHNNKKATAERVMKLFHMFSAEDSMKPVTFEYLIEGLNNSELPIRMLSYWHLKVLAPNEHNNLLERKFYYDPAASPDRLAAAVVEWHREIPRGKLPGEAPPPKKKKTP